MRLLFYSDVDVFGGHEVTVLDAIEGAAMVPGVRIGIAYCKQNQLFGDHLRKRFGTSSSVEMLPHNFVHEKGDMLRAFIPSAKRRAIAGFIEKWNPAFMIVCQGHMGVSICALSAAVGTKTRVISYIPMAHTFREMTGEDSITVRTVDALLARAYQWPAIYLTSNDCVADQLKSIHGVASDRIFIIEYGPDLEQLQKVSRTEARAALGLGGEFYIGMVGRVDFRQKGHDIVFESIKRHGGLTEEFRLLIVGEGPDAQRMKSFVKDHRFDNFIKFIPYCSNISLLLSALDALLIPSRYEGVPVVMLQAMYFGLPVIAADVDGMKTVLPDDWRFAPGSGDQFMAALDRVCRGVDPELLERNKQYIIKTLNATHFREKMGSFVEDLSRSC